MNNFKIEFNGNYDELWNNEKYKDSYGCYDNNDSEQNQNSSLNKDITDISGDSLLIKMILLEDY